MEVDSNFSSLLRNLKIEDPWVPPKAWESIPSESGPDRSGDSAQTSPDPFHDLSTISELILVRLVINALQGVKSALVEIDQLLSAFSSSPADRTSHRIRSLWCRSSSTCALGMMLKSISHSGLVFFFLRGFVNYYLHSSVTGESGDTNNGGANTKDSMLNKNSSIQAEAFCLSDDIKLYPPYTLVNQAFSVAVGKVLEGYLSAFDTLLASVKLRRSGKHGEATAYMTGGAGILTSVVNSEITVLEVYLHTEELRTYIEALGNICFPKVTDFTTLRGSLTADSTVEYHDFPRGAELLTYLYVLLRDADPRHHGLLKYLFVQACEPYCVFIKSWIYHARIDDPYGEFFVVYLDNSVSSDGSSCSVDGFPVASIKVRDSTSVPCFLKDFCRPLIRAGQQLDILVKLLSVCNNSVIKGDTSCGLTNFEDVLPFWVDRPSNLTSLLSPVAFNRTGIQVLLRKRATTYGILVENLQKFFRKLDLSNQKIDCNVISFGSLLGRRIGVNSPFSLVFDGDLITTSATGGEEITVMGSGSEDTDDSSFCKTSFDVEQSQASDSSSCYSYEEADPKAFTELPDISHQPSQVLLSNIYSFKANEKVLHDSESEKPGSLQHSSHDNYQTSYPVILLPCQHHENKSSQISATLQSNEIKYAKFSGIHDEGYLSVRCWPLGALLQNPFFTDTKYVPKQLWSTECDHQEAYDTVKALEAENSNFVETSVPSSSEFDITKKTQLNGTSGTLSVCSHQSWNSSLFDLSINPMVTRAALLRTLRGLRDRNFISVDETSIPCFDFSSVADPCSHYIESTMISHSHESGDEDPKFVSSAAEVTENFNVLVQSKVVDGSIMSSVSSSRVADVQPDILPQSASGGAGWEGLLNYSGENVFSALKAEGLYCDSIEMFETPLDVIIDKSILQDILVQYKYVSNFAIKLLEEGFDLRDHLLALRRYHFMELADWADTFIMSSRNYKWSVIDPEQRIAKIQGLLDFSLQRSSCENDRYRERLFVYTKGEGTTLQSASATGIHAFNFMNLGYRVDWPVNIIITHEALKTYADIFSYLIQVRLAVISLTDIAHWLKARMSYGKQSRSTESHKMEFATLMRIRQQISHFVSTLQQYVHSQLSDVSWCKFQRSLEHQVKDMLDLESVHMSYLADALHICFLSSETRQIAVIIKNILQCALDFRLCFPGSGLVDVQSDGKDPFNLLRQINFSQVFLVKSTFEKNIRDLYALYLKSPKHGEFSLCRFWSYLNYNDYYSLTITKEKGFFASLDHVRD